MPKGKDIKLKSILSILYRLSKYNFLFFIFPLLFFKGNAQVSQSVIIDRINTKDLTNPFISSLFQDQKGYLWIGTIGGLNKYNGYGFIKYRCFPKDSTSLSHPSITSFNQTDADNIFIGTRKGLNIYNYNSNNFKQLLIDQNVKNAALKNNINCILSNKKNEKLIGTGDGVYKYNAGKNKLEAILDKKNALLEGWSVRCMCFDRLGNLWIGAKKNDAANATHRVFKYNFNSKNLWELNVHDNSEHFGISEDYLGNIWVGVNNGLVSINPGTYKLNFYKAPENFYSNVAYAHTKDNVIWQCYWSFGLTSFDIDKKEFNVYRNDPDNRNSLMSNKCWALLKDDNDILWIGSDVGLQKITSQRPGIEIIKRNSLNEKRSFKGNIIMKALASRKQNDIVFAGIDGEGFAIYNRLTKQSTNFGPNSENANDERFVNQFIEDENSDLYVLGQNNFQKITFNTGSPSVKSYFAFQEHYSACGITDPLNKNKLWIGGRAEIYCFDKQTQRFTFLADTLQIKEVFYSAFSINNHIYFGYKNGLLKLDPAKGAFEKISLPDVGNIMSTLVLNDNEVLLSSQFLGLIKFFPKTKNYLIIYKTKHEYFSEPSSLLFYKNNVWLSGNTGLTCINQTTGETSEISTDDGLPSNIIHKTDLLDGYFYLATHEGLAIINPDFQVSHFISPKIDITQIQVLTDSSSFVNLKSGGEIELTEKQNSFRINFTVLDFNLPEKNRFKFQLLPIQTEWQSPVGENFLIFNSLSPGNYQFNLLGANADHIWSTEPFIINIKIVPPFYKTAWFKIFCVTLLIVIGFTFAFLRIRADNKKQELLEKIIKERTAEIQMQRAELLDSISYAERIQKAIFVGENILSESLQQSFIFHKPKSKLSGDFYWIGKYKDLLIVFAGDCTGHGVPGAMLSIIGTSILNKIVHEENIYLPGEILTRLNYLFYNQLSLGVENIRDGMDASVLTINIVNNSVYYAGAKLDAVCITNGEMTDLKGQRHSIGENDNIEFKTQNIPFENDRYIYLFSDGIKDQHGGPDKKKFSIKRFKEVLLRASSLPINEQKQFISETINSWKGNSSQTDDMILIGLKI